MKLGYPRLSQAKLNSFADVVALELAAGNIDVNTYPGKLFAAGVKNGVGKPFTPNNIYRLRKRTARTIQKRLVDLGKPEAWNAVVFRPPGPRNKPKNARAPKTAKPTGGVTPVFEKPATPEKYRALYHIEQLVKSNLPPDTKFMLISLTLKAPGDAI